MSREEENQIIGEAVRRLPGKYGIEVMEMGLWLLHDGWLTVHSRMSIFELAQAILADEERFPAEPK